MGLVDKNGFIVVVAFLFRPILGPAGKTKTVERAANKNGTKTVPPSRLPRTLVGQASKATVFNTFSIRFHTVFVFPPPRSPTGAFK